MLPLPSKFQQGYYEKYGTLQEGLRASFIAGLTSALSSASVEPLVSCWVKLSSFELPLSGSWEFSSCLMSIVTFATKLPSLTIKDAASWLTAVGVLLEVASAKLLAVDAKTPHATRAKERMVLDETRHCWWA